MASSYRSGDVVSTDSKLDPGELKMGLRTVMRPGPADVAGVAIQTTTFSTLAVERAAAASMANRHFAK
jgi:hypothetical protein